MRWIARTQRTSAELRVVTLLGQEVLGGLGELDAEALALELTGETLGHQVDHLHDLALGELVEDDDLVDAVQELRAEVRLERVHDLVLHALVAHRLVGLGEADVGLAQVLGAQVRGHDDDGVAEVDRAALAVGETALLQDLEQRVEHVGVGLFDLVEQHHAERLAPHGLGELAALFVARRSRGASRRDG